MLRASFLDKSFAYYSTGPLTHIEPEQEALFLLIPDADRTTEVLPPASYRTAGYRVETLDIMRKIQHVFHSPISPISDRQVPMALAMLTRNDTGTSCWLCLDGHTVYRCAYFTLEQVLFTAHRNLEHRTTADAGIERLLMQEAQKINPASYLARL